MFHFVGTLFGFHWLRQEEIIFFLNTTCSRFTIYFDFMLSWYISQKTSFDLRCGILSSEWNDQIPMEACWRKNVVYEVFVRSCMLWRHRGHFGVQTDQKLSNYTWNWEQRNQVTASRVYSLRQGATSLHAGQKSLRMKLHLANLTGGNISLRMQLYWQFDCMPWWNIPIDSIIQSIFQFYLYLSQHKYLKHELWNHCKLIKEKILSLGLTNKDIEKIRWR